MTPTSSSRRPTVWMVLAGVFALMVVGLGIWVFMLSSENSRVKSELASEQTQLEKKGAEQRQTSTALKKSERHFKAVSRKLGVSSKDLSEAKRKVRKLGRQKGSAQKEAAKERSSATSEKKRADNAEACLGGVLLAFKHVLDARNKKAAVKRAPGELRDLSPACKAVI